jgi:Na+/melibiose symporter-like transporter
MKIILYPAFAILLAAAAVVIYSMADTVHQHDRIVNQMKNTHAPAPGGNMANSIKNHVDR